MCMSFGTDIGAYDTCGHLCKYCYANVNPVLVKENMRKHNPASSFLIGGYMQVILSVRQFRKAGLTDRSDWSFRIK